MKRLFPAAAAVLMMSFLYAGCGTTANNENNNSPTAVIKTAPTATIYVDGISQDWAGIEPLITDASGDSDYSGLDITAVFVAHDSGTVFFRLDRVGGNLPQNEYSNFWIYLRPAGTGKKGYAFEFFHSSPTVYEARLWDISANPDDYNSFVRLSSSVTNSFGAQTIEFSVPKSMITMEHDFELSFFTHHTMNYQWQNGGDSADQNVDVVFD